MRRIIFTPSTNEQKGGDYTRSHWQSQDIPLCIWHRRILPMRGKRVVRKRRVWCDATRGGNWDRRQTERKQYWNGSFPALITDSLANEILRMFLCHSWDSDDSWQLRSQTEIDCLHPLGNNTSVWGTTWEWQRRWFYHHLHLQLPFLEHVRLSSLSLSLSISFFLTHILNHEDEFLFFIKC